MKKIIIALTICLVSISINAQETNGDSVLKSKKGYPILPKAGDYAIGVGADAFLYYVGNLFNNTQDNSLDLYDQTVYGRYFLSDNTALQLSVSIDSYNSISRQYIQDDAAVYADPLSNAKVEDNYKYKSAYYAFNLEYLKFRGTGRLRGYCGAGLGYSYGRYQYIYQYGNEITGINTTPTIYYTSYTSNSARILSEDYGISNQINLSLVAGVEYYIFPKIAIGGQLALSGYYSWRTQGNSKYERWNGSTVVEYDELYSPKGKSGSGIYTENLTNLTGGLYLMFHF